MQRRWEAKKKGAGAGACLLNMGQTTRFGSVGPTIAFYGHGLIIISRHSTLR